LPTATNPKKQTNDLSKLALSSAVVGHLVEQQFSSETIATGAIVWLIGVLIVSGELPAVYRPAYTARNKMQLITILQYILTAFLIVFAVIQPLRADIAYKKSQDWSTSEVARFETAEKVVRRWPFQPEYWQGLAITSAQAGDLITTHDAIDTALLLEPDNPQTYALWGDLLTGVLYHIPGTLPQAATAYQTAVQLAPTVAGYHTSLGVILEQQGDFIQSRLVLERAVMLDPAEPFAWSSLASTYAALGEQDLAQQARQRSEELLRKE
jgi:cytochrome c-type biogenesis protein CcmH/NrfG